MANMNWVKGAKVQSYFTHVIKFEVGILKPEEEILFKVPLNFIPSNFSLFLFI
jgi:hypothetical protein